MPCGRLAPTLPSWTWSEIEAMWAHPDWTAAELHELIPRHSPRAIKDQRVRMGRYGSAPICCMCDERPVWMESPKAKRYRLCKGCYLDEERMRIEDDARAVALRQQRRRARKRQQAQEG